LNAFEKFSVDVLAAFAASRKGREAFVSRDFRAR
jgi:hypothetical protein